MMRLLPTGAMTGECRPKRSGRNCIKTRALLGRPKMAWKDDFSRDRMATLSSCLLRVSVWMVSLSAWVWAFIGRVPFTAISPSADGAIISISKVAMCAAPTSAVEGNALGRLGSRDDGCGRLKTKTPFVCHKTQKNKPN